MIVLKRTIASMAIAFIAAVGGNATAEIYKCKLKSGKVEMRDFPCDLSARPATPSSLLPTRPESSRGTANPIVPVPVPGFTDNAQYAAARSICLRLMSQYDFTAPMMRCGLNDSTCFDRANQESKAIFQRLIALPEWKRQQCDLVIQVEGEAASNVQNNFEVVGTINGCKYFVAEQGASYSLVEDWMCFRPSRGDVGQGDISSFGMKEVKMNGQACTLYVDDWMLGRSRAAEKLRAKCP